MTDLAFGLQVTAIGMGLVFALLGLLWLLLDVVGRLDRALEARAEAPGAAQAPPPASPATEADELDAEALAAVTVAVALHAAQLRREAAPALRSTRPGSQIFASRWLAAGRTRQTGSFTPRR